ncbi:exopolyphosphatase-like protein [Diplogelasinospora grovesii]|uniref:Exopolyphosphatase-like protein n=1 Tax=Diplogelasinospora grovesii TaxID=303347 RepID=A0AAN6N804_9PEZI|nr:exopolyphosphatase-like protein [Diplogelasinospora grovesii]
MAARRTSLKTFLGTARKVLSTPQAPQRPFTFVIGNESADLDSLCSAVLLAYFKTFTPPHTLHIPLSNLLRPDLALHPELNAVLSPAGLQVDDLLTLSDLPSPLPAEATRWLLVDHNALTGQLAEKYSDRVIGCVDHHEDEHKVPQDADPRVIEKCGSCMSLVVDHCRDVWDSLPKVDGGDELAYVALAPILVDTTNLTAYDKVTRKDTWAVEFSESKLASGQKEAGVGYERGRYFDEINRLKEEISGMSYQDILRKDYKLWKEGGLSLGISVVPQPFEYLLEKIGDREKLLGELKKWSEEQGLDITSIMTAYKDKEGNFGRELLVWALNEDAVKVAKSFESKNSEKLGLVTWNDGQLDEKDEKEGEWRKAWTQKAIENSRKQVAPMLRDAMKASKL